VPVRYSNCKVWLGYGLGFSDSLTVDGAFIVENSVLVDQEVDCDGKVVIPAFVDAHSHPVLAGRESFGPQISDCASIDELKGTVKSWIEANPETDWVVGGAYNRALSPDGKFLAAWLDEVSVSVPIVLHADDHHTIWVNTEAMRRAAVLGNPSAVSVEGVDVNRQGEPSGVFRETNAKNLILKHLPQASDESDLAALKWSHTELLRLGITATLDAWVDERIARVYSKAAASGELGVKSNLALWLEPHDWREQLDSAANYRLTLSGSAQAGARANTVKYFVDGVFGSATASVTEPYQTTKGFGTRFWTDVDLTESCRKASELGFQLHLHTIGDEAVTATLNALEKCRDSWLNNAHPVLAHVELANDQAVQRCRALGVSVVMQPTWARPDALLQSSRQHLGDRTDSLYRTRDFVTGGVEVAFGSDWPVSSPNPFLGLYTAVTRRVQSNGEVQNPEQRINLEQALHAYTAVGASQLGLTQRGTLLPGQAADFLFISHDPFEDIEALTSIQVLKTISGGQTRFTRH
jgi:hypothetical protein